MNKAIAWVWWLALIAAPNSLHAQPYPPITERPIVWDSLRQALTTDYLRQRHGLPAQRPVIQPKMVVVHWTAIPTLEGSFRAFDPPMLPGARADIQQASPLNVSAHYLIDRDGSIYRLLPDTLMARHCIGLNWCAIGIENVGDGDKHPLTEAQYHSNLQLIRALMQRHPIQYVIGHHEYRRFRRHRLYRETDPAYATVKSDVGDAFMQRLRGDLGKGKLKRVPSLPPDTP